MLKTQRNCVFLLDISAWGAGAGYTQLWQGTELHQQGERRQWEMNLPSWREPPQCHHGHGWELTV